jgi:hypothetical protein
MVMHTDNSSQHIVLFILFILFKLINGKLFKPWGVHLNPDVSVLIRELDRLHHKKIEPPSARSKIKRIFSKREKHSSTEREINGGMELTEDANYESTMSGGNLRFADDEVGPTDRY